MADEVLIIGVERDCECLCLGEKGSKQRRLGGCGSIAASSWKGKEPLNASRRLLGKKTATRLSTEHEAPIQRDAVNWNSSDDHSVDTNQDRDSNSNQHLLLTPPAASMQFHQPNGRREVNTLSSQPTSVGATSKASTSEKPTNQQDAFSMSVDLNAAQGSSQPADFDPLYRMSESEWDRILDLGATSTINFPFISSANPMSSGINTSVLAADSTAASCSPLTSSGAVNFDTTTEKDSATHHVVPANGIHSSATLLSNSAPSINPNYNDSVFLSADYPTSSGPSSSCATLLDNQSTMFSPSMMTHSSSSPVLPSSSTPALTATSPQPASSLSPSTTLHPPQPYNTSMMAFPDHQQPYPPLTTPHDAAAAKSLYPPSQQLTQCLPPAAQVQRDNAITQSQQGSSDHSTGGGAAAVNEHLQNDENLARKLQEEEFIKGMRRSKHGDEKLALRLFASDLAIGQPRNTVQDVAMASMNEQYLQQHPSVQMAASFSSPTINATSPIVDSSRALSTTQHVSGEQLQQQNGPADGNSSKHPTCWTECPNCPSDVTRKYHLIDVEQGSPEWNVVSQPLVQAGFGVTRVGRIQNEMLWQRLCFEKQLMRRDRPSCNERFLYHTSRAEVSVICEEGLDPRLSRNGLFGSGIYFSDNPIKCDKYWSTRHNSERTMFCCRVLLGDTKVYPKGKSEQLKREPPKEFPLPGQPKNYDSVQGNISGQDEFVVYNAYRVMPEYVITYSSTGTSFYAPPPGRCGLWSTPRRLHCKLASKLRLAAAKHRQVAQMPYYMPVLNLTPPSGGYSLTNVPPVGQFYPMMTGGTNMVPPFGTCRAFSSSPVMPTLSNFQPPPVTVPMPFPPKSN